MAEEKKNIVNSKDIEDDSNIDQINSFVTSTDNGDENIEVTDEVNAAKIDDDFGSDDEKPVIAEEKKAVKKEVVNKINKNNDVKKTDKHTDIKKIDKNSDIKKTIDKTDVKKNVSKNNYNNQKVLSKNNKKEAHNIKAEHQVHNAHKKDVHKPNKISKNNGGATMIKSKHVEKNSVKENHKTKNNSNKTKSNKAYKFSKNTLIWIGIGVLAAVLVIAIVLLLSVNKNAVINNNQTASSVAATVNGDPIYLQDILTKYNNLDTIQKQTYTVESILNKSIDDLLLYQEAKTTGIVVDSKEVVSELDAVRTQNGMTEKEFEDALAKQGMTIDKAKEVITQGLAIRELLDKTILSKIDITSSQIRAYYDTNVAKFKVADQVTVQHILVLITPNVTDSQAKTNIDEINSKLNSTNFCDLVTQYSEDQGSISNCGMYTFAKGDFNNPEFENPSFDLKINETTIVKTTFGYHLIKKLETIPARTMELSEVESQINTTLYDQVAQTAFDNLMTQLRAKALIIDYYNKDNTNLNNTVLVPIDNLDNFAKCLTEHNATMYGAYWCPHCEAQKKLFGASLKYVNYVECAVVDQPQVQVAECTDAGITGYPTWVVNGKQYPGEQSFDKLTALTGCSQN